MEFSLFWRELRYVANYAFCVLIFGPPPFQEKINHSETWWLPSRYDYVHDFSYCFSVAEVLSKFEEEWDKTCRELLPKPNPHHNSKVEKLHLRKYCRKEIQLRNRFEWDNIRQELWQKAVRAVLLYSDRQLPNKTHFSNWILSRKEFRKMSFVFNLYHPTWTSFDTLRLFSQMKKFLPFGAAVHQKQYIHFCSGKNSTVESLTG